MTVWVFERVKVRDDADMFSVLDPALRSTVTVPKLVIVTVSSPDPPVMLSVFATVILLFPELRDKESDPPKKSNEMPVTVLSRITF